MGKWLIICAIVLSGCGSREQAQHASDSRSAIAAGRAVVKKLVEAGPSISVYEHLATIDNVLAGVDARLPAISGINSQEWPQPAQTPAFIAEDQAMSFAATAPPEPPKSSFWLYVGGAAVTLLGLFRVAAPLLPGPMGQASKGILGSAANAVYWLMSHRDQKRDDAVAESALGLVDAAAEKIAAIKAAIPDEYEKLPKSIKIICDQIEAHGKKP